jgi:hypothetical protein
MEKFFALTGWVREDCFGRVVIDECPSDEAHLQSSKTDAEINKPSCRFLLEQFFTRGTDMLGRHGLLKVSFGFEPTPGVGSIEEAVTSYLEQSHAA